MPTCPDCGSIIMKGDPYCSHCGAHLSWSDDYDYRREHKIPDYIDSYDPMEEFRKSEQRRQDLLEKISNYYKVELEYLDVKDTYTEYIFLRKTPYYTLKIVATDQYGNTIGVKENETEVDFTKLLENEDYQNLVKDLDVETITTNLCKDEIHIHTDEIIYLLDMDNKKLIEKNRFY